MNQPLGQALQQVAALLERGDAAGAYAACRPLAERAPGEANVWYLLGMAAFRMGHGEEALSCLDRALAIRPKGPVMRMHRGQVRCALGRMQEGLEDLREAVRLKPDLAEAQEALTTALANLGRQGEAIEACRTALARMPGLVGIRARLADLLEQKSRLDEAAREAEAVLQARPGDSRARFILARVEARRGELASARDRLQALLAQRLPPQQVSAIAGALARVLERLGEFDAAFEAAERANRATLEMVPPALREDEGFLRRIEVCREMCTAERLAAWSKEGQDDGIAAPLFLVGFPRSGTTLTEQILTASGQVHPSDEQPILLRLIEELGDYPACLAGLTAEDAARLRRRYFEIAENLCGPLPANRRFLDKLPLNLVDLGLITRLFPEAKVLVLLRDPRDVCLSCIFNQFIPNEAMIHFTDIERTGRLYAAVMGLWLHYRDNLPLAFREQRYEDLVEDFEGQTRALLDFFGLEWTPTVLRFHEQVGERDVCTPSYAAISNPVSNKAVGRWRNYRNQLQPLMQYLDPFVEEFGYR